MLFISAKYFYGLIFTAGAGIVQSVYQWARGWMAKESLFNSQEGQEIFLLPIASKPAVRPTQPPIQWVLGTLVPRVKQPGHEDDHSSSSSAKVKNMWSYISTPPYVFMMWSLIN
jgi:hypothetical protein